MKITLENILTNFTSKPYPIPSINKEIFKIAVPNIVANISIPLLGIVDTMLMGRMDDPAYIGAIALGGIIFNILYWGLGFLRPGTTGITAQNFGNNNIQECFLILYRSAFVGLSIGILLWLFRTPIGDFAFSFLSGSSKVESLALEYYSIRILAAPAVISGFALRGWFYGMQDAITPMILTIFVNLTNILLSYYLVIHLDWSVQGVAWGTMIAQWSAFLLGLVFLLFKHKTQLFKYLSKAIFYAKSWGRFLLINRDMFIRNLGLILVFSYFTNYSSSISDEYLAINQILIQLFYFMSYAVDGFAYASESLVGKYIGQKDISTLKIIVKKCLYYGLGFAAVFSVAYILFGQTIFSWFSNDAALINMSSAYFIWLAIVAICGALAFIWDGVYSGATAAKELRDSMLISTIIFFVSFYIFKAAYPLHTIWIAMAAFMLSRSLFQIFFYKSRILIRLER